MTLSWTLVAVGISEIVAVWLIYRIWKSSDHLGFKVAYSVLALIPFFGPFLLSGRGIRRRHCPMN
jgi:hypothetical protein